jgi:hypothetical protein
MAIQGAVLGSAYMIYMWTTSLKDRRVVEKEV